MNARIRLAAVVAAASAGATALLALGTGSAVSDPSTELLPDLIVERPAELYLATSKKANRLRLSHTVSNDGPGPLEVFPGDADDDCDENGAISQERFAFQRVFYDSEPGDGEFHRVDTDGHPADTSAIAEKAGCMRYHPSHHHWHFDQFARYTLIRERTGALVGRAQKVSFCIVDGLHPYPALPGSPSAPYYPHSPEVPDAFTSCSETSIDGLSVGWGDTYGAALPGQAINLHDSGGGRFCLILDADPGDQLREVDETNNRRVLRIGFSIRHQTVRTLEGACESPLPLP